MSFFGEKFGEVKHELAEFPTENTKLSQRFSFSSLIKNSWILRKIILVSCCIISVIFFFSVFHHNSLKTANDEKFSSYEKYSNLLVEMPIVNGEIRGLADNNDFIDSRNSPNILKNYLCPLNVIDENWENGVHKKTAAILVSNNKLNRSLNLPNVGITFKDGTRRNIQFTKENGNNLEVYLEGKPLSPKLGYPWMYHSDIKMKLSDYAHSAEIICRFFTFIKQFHPPVWFYTCFLAIALAVALTCIGYFIGVELGVRYSIIFGLAIVLSQRLVMMGRNLYWAPFLFFLPVLFMCVFLKTKKKVYAFLCAFCLLLKFMNGYEFLTTICILTCVPIVYFAAKEKWKISTIVKMFLFWVTVSVLLFLLSVLIAYFIGGEYYFRVIIERGAFRTFGETSLYYPDHPEASFGGNVNKYLLDGFPILFPFPIPTYVFIVISLCCAYSLLFKSSQDVETEEEREEQKKRRAIGVATIFSLLAPWSWFLLARNHSYIHTHINHVLYAISFVPMAFLAMFAFFEMHTKNCLRFLHLFRRKSRNRV